MDKRRAGAKGSNHLEFPLATLRRDAGRYVLRLERPIQFLSSACVGEGLVESRWVLSRQVDPDACLPDPESYLREEAGLAGIPGDEPFVGLLTAVCHHDLQVVSMTEAHVAVTVIATVGVDPGSSPQQMRVADFGVSDQGLPGGENRSGTINMVVLLDAALTLGALVRASTVATEAKTLALIESGLKTTDGQMVTGTPTDVTVVGHLGRGGKFKYSGPATLVGWLVGQASYRCVRDGLAAYIKRNS